MGKIYFTSDLHFGHENVIKFDNRPFKTVEEMDEELIRRWNAKVGKGDLVYVLGDMIWKSRNGDAEQLIKSLNGQIILIKGNHDRFLHNAKAKNALAGVKDRDDICVTLEDGTVKGGLGSAVLEYMAENGYSPKVEIMGIPDEFIEHGTPAELYGICHMSQDDVLRAILKYKEL